MHPIHRRQGLRPTAAVFVAVALATGISRNAVAAADWLYAHEATGTQHQGHHHHGQVEVSAGQPIPKVKLLVHPDAKQGWNVEIQVANFSFAPERINTKGNTSEGHAHLYVDTQKIARVYSSWYHLATLPPGKHTLRVTLNTNTHDQLMHQGQPIEATATVVVPPRSGKSH